MTQLRDFSIPSPLFAADSAWNLPAEGAVAIADNARYAKTTDRILRAAGIRTMSVNFDEFTFPIFRMKPPGVSGRDVEMRTYGGEQFRPLTVPWYRTGDERVFARGIPEPAGTVRPSLPADLKSDGALILYCPETDSAYDFWQATTQNGGAGVEGSEITAAGNVSWFPLRRSEALGCQLPAADPRLPTTLPRGSARASGVPYLGGLLLPEDVARGEIPHGLVFTLPQLRHTPFARPTDPPDYIYPASRTETKKFTDDPFALAAGMRIRLKFEVFDDAGNQVNEDRENTKLVLITRMFFEALRRYGAYLVDGSLGFGFAAEDIHTAWLDVDVDKVAALVGGTAAAVQQKLDGGMTKWQIVMTKLDEQLNHELGSAGPSPISFATAGGVSNFDVVEGPSIPDINWQRRVTSTETHDNP